jgi:hypothetical protein
MTWSFCSMLSLFVQLRTNKVIKFYNLRTKFFIKILTSDSESGASKTFRKGVTLVFPCIFGRAKFLGLFNTPKNPWNWPSLDQFCAICDAHITCGRWMCKKKDQGPIMSFYRKFDLERVCPCDNFSEIPTLGGRFFGNDFNGIR